jgi:hypothetical protein
MENTMKITEVINALQALLITKGDLEVFYSDECGDILISKIEVTRILDIELGTEEGVMIL